MTNFIGLVLAGSRGPADALADAEGARHRALVPVCGIPMLVRVVRTLTAAPSVGPLIVSIDDPTALASVPELRSDAVRIHTSLRSPSRSVSDVLGGLDSGEELLVTTADHPLLTPAMVEHFAAAAAANDADLLVGVVAAPVVDASYPGATRTYLKLRDGRYTGANLFAFRSERGRRVADFWVRAEAFRKRPWRLAGAIGAGTLLLFALGRLDLDGALERISRSVGARVRAVRLPFAEAAIDVDRPSDLELASRILTERSKEERRGG